MININIYSIFGVPPYSFFAAMAFLAGYTVLCFVLRGHSAEYRVLPRFAFREPAYVITGGYFVGILIGLAMGVYKGNIYCGFSNGVGFVAYGGIFGTLLCTVRHSKRYKLDMGLMLDSISCAVAVAHGIARLGCLTAGCCYGIEYHGALAVHYVSNDMYCFPVQLAETVLNILLGITLICLFFKYKFKGRLVYVYLITYSIYRFVLEFFRGDTIRGIFGVFSSSQYISAAVFVETMISILKKLKTSEKN